MEYFCQQLINGLALGSIYGLIAIGYTMVYGIIGMINFAHGDIFMVGAFIALIAFLGLVAIGVTAIPIALFLVLLIAMALSALYGQVVERVAYRPLRHSFRLAPLISAIGMSIILQNYVQVAQGARVKPLPPLIRGGYTLLQSESFPVQVSNVQIIIMVTTLAPCWYCSGLLRQFGFGTVIVGESRNFQGGIEWLRSLGINVVDLDSKECASMLSDYIRANPAVWNEDIGEE